MRAGDLDRRIVILRAATTRDAMNEAVPTWSALATVWASVTPVGDGERLRAGQVLASRMVRFVVRYSSVTATVDPRDRVQFDGRVYDINGVKEIGRRVGLEITATARAETP